MGAFPFLELPRELRDQIYIQYFTAPDKTYVYDFHSKKLRLSDKTPISVGLALTCKTVNHETRGMGLRLNTITFYPIYSDELRALASRFGQAMYHLKGTITSTLSTISSVMNYNNPHEPRPLTRLKELVYPDRNFEDWNLESILSMDVDPWRIPTESEVENLVAILFKAKEEARGKKYTEGLDYLYAWHPDHGKYRFSAASAAIYFLRSIPDQRRHMRNMVICEDRRSVAYPEWHGRGLVPFCQENPALRITRRVSLWGNIFRHDMDERHWQYQVCTRNAINKLSLDRATTVLAAWIAEAGILPSIGMPTGQYTLFLDGDPLSEKTSEIFGGYIQRAALLQDVIVKAPRGADWTFIQVHRYMDHFISELFPQMLKDLSDNPRSGLIQCNFDPGQRSVSAEEILATHPEWDPYDWDEDLWNWPGGEEETIVPGLTAMQMEDMVDSFRELYPNGPPLRCQSGDPPDWAVEVDSDIEPDEGEDQNEGDGTDGGGDHDSDSNDEADAHEADV
ncbi:unnamed protein product [Clonostachys rosea]|uniref:HNH nuclease domain-containing protein n=1 Tax=Bionectria ochroleuca TaxID=29856 RepID=A0ABY6ULF4_BIOOC|nr:unnamed protein product [Clonostachys rosea]